MLQIFSRGRHTVIWPRNKWQVFHVPLLLNICVFYIQMRITLPIILISLLELLLHITFRELRFQIWAFTVLASARTTGADDLHFQTGAPTGPWEWAVDTPAEEAYSHATAVGLVFTIYIKFWLCKCDGDRLVHLQGQTQFITTAALSPVEYEYRWLQAILPNTVA
jgi:hypothetical protein